MSTSANNHSQRIQNKRAGLFLFLHHFLFVNKANFHAPARFSLSLRYLHLANPSR